jgi:hypothetical protein
VSAKALRGLGTANTELGAEKRTAGDSHGARAIKWPLAEVAGRYVQARNHLMSSGNVILLPYISVAARKILVAPRKER